MGEGGEVLIVKLDNVKACNKECHSVLRIYFVIIYYSPLKTNNSAIFFCHMKLVDEVSFNYTYLFLLDFFFRMLAIFQVRETRYI